MTEKWNKLENERVILARHIIGNTSDETLDNLVRIRKECNQAGQWFTLLFLASELSEMKRSYLEKGNVPGISKLGTLPDFILYVQTDGSIKVIKERVERTNAVISRL